jgi:lactonase family protein with 7-bladed beta-propeller
VKVHATPETLTTGIVSARNVKEDDMNRSRTDPRKGNRPGLARRNFRAILGKSVLSVLLGLGLAGLAGLLRAQTAQISGFAYTANGFCTCESGMGTQGGSGSVSAFTLDAQNGTLTQVAGSPFPAGLAPHAVTVDPTGHFVYVANHDSNNVSAYTINPQNGALTPIPGSPFAAGTGPHGVTFDPTGQFVYVANHLSNNVSAYIINPRNGALSPIPGSPFPAGAGAGTGPLGVTTTAAQNQQ